MRAFLGYSRESQGIRGLPRVSQDVSGYPEGCLWLGLGHMRGALLGGEAWAIPEVGGCPSQYGRRGPQTAPG